MGSLWLSLLLVLGVGENIAHTFGPLSMSPRKAAEAALAAALLLACSAQWASAQTETPPDPALFAPVQLAGDLSTGFAAYFIGCANGGATLQDIIVYANDNFLRGLEVNLTDGTNVQFGCVNTTSGATGCKASQLDTSIRMASFRFAPGELVTHLSVYPGPDNAGRANTRAGALSFATSMGRLFDFGNKQSRNSPVVADTASGIPCGVASRRGADIDALGFVFLRAPTLAVLSDVAYSGLPTDQASGRGFNATYRVAQLQNQTYDNSARSEPHTYAYAQDFAQMRPSAWSHALGLDSYAGPNVTAGVPTLASTHNGSTPAGWLVSPPAPHQRREDGLQADQWSYNTSVPAGAIYNVRVTLLQASITVPYTGNLTMVLDSGANVTIPVNGTYQGTTYAQADIQPVVIKEGMPKTASANTYGTNVVAPAGGKRPWWPIVLGVLLGVLVAALVAGLFVVAGRRRAARQAQQARANHLGPVPSAYAGAGGGGKENAGGAYAGPGGAAPYAGKGKAVRPVTPRARAAPPGGAAAAESAKGGGVLGRVLPAGVASSRFQRLFRGKGHAEEEELGAAERGLSNSSTHNQQVPEIPLGDEEPSPMRGFSIGGGGGGGPSGLGSGTAPDQASPTPKASTAAPAPAQARGTEPSQSVSGVTGPDGGAAAPKLAAAKRGSIEHEGMPIKLSGRSRRQASLG